MTNVRLASLQGLFMWVGWVRLEGELHHAHLITQEMKEAVELPLTHPELYEDIGIRPPKGVILYGEPGTGKTLLAKVLPCDANAWQGGPLSPVRFFIFRFPPCGFFLGAGCRKPDLCDILTRHGFGAHPEVFRRWPEVGAGALPCCR